VNTINLETLQYSVGTKPILLSSSQEHNIYWLGIDDETPFRCNVYMIEDGDEYIIVDPGSRSFFEQIKQRVATIVDPSKVGGLILCHQDPDVAASMVDWLELNPDMTIISSARTNVLLPHYGVSDYKFFDIASKFEWRFKSGNVLEFIEAPFLHFPGAFTTLDKNSCSLFSGDIWAALDTEWKLVVEDFTAHKTLMDLFHIDYMASNKAALGFVQKLENKNIETIFPQHGSIIPKKYIEDAKEYLVDLECGLDLLYPEL